MRTKILLALLSSFLLFAGADASSPGRPLESHIQGEPVKVELIHEVQTIQPGTPFWVAFRFEIADDWHSYWKNPGDAGLPTTVSWQLPEGFSVGTLHWPAPKRFTSDSVIGYGYDKELILLALITPSENPTEMEVEISAKLEWLACSDSACQPGEAELKIMIPMSVAPPPKHPDWAELIATAYSRLPQKVENEGHVQRKASLIELTAPAEGDFFPTTASFYPEESSMIDETVEASFSHDKEKGEYLVLLKEPDAQESKGETLKGILALSDDNGRVSFRDLNLPIVEGESAGVGAEAAGSLAFFLVTAFIGGLILNLMPCVLPVVSLKVLSFVKMAREKRSLTLKHGLAFFFGVVASFWVLAGALLILQAYGNAVGWGFQLQDPLFVGAMAAVILVFSLSMFGLFEVGTFFSSWAGTKECKKREESLISSFFSGILATAIATPCTGPFLGPAIGFAVAQPPVVALTVFTSLGVGMASPYLLLAAFPELLRFIPKPGNWMITFKEITGFILLATVFWLLWIFSGQTDSLALFTLLAGLFLLSIGCWIYGKWCTPVKRKRTRLISMAATVFAFLAGGNLILSSAAQGSDTHPSQEHVAGKPTAWEPFSRARLDELLAAGTPVFVDFTARWCLICQTNHLVLSSRSVSDTFEKQGVVRMKADWTKHNPEITEELKKHGRSGVPLYLLYTSSSDAPVVLPQVLTAGTVIEQLKQTQ